MRGKMLKLLTGCAVFIFLFVFASSAQSFDAIAGAIQAGSASSLAAKFSGNVAITIKDSEANYSKTQAEMVLKNFFNSHRPKSFSVVHQGASPEGSKYFIGSLITSNGNFRTYVYAKLQGNTLIIQEMRFEAE